MVNARSPGIVVLVMILAGCGPGQSSASGTESGTEPAMTDTTDSTESSDSSGGESETGDETSECLLAIRIDLCCNQAYPALPAELDADPCIVAWPIDWAALPDELVNSCAMAAPDWCQDIDCDFAPPASEQVEPDGMGGCQWLCPADTYPAYREPGCGQPPPFVECLGTPPPCADEYCSCEGETIYGCGQVSEPFADFGPC